MRTIFKDMLLKDSRTFQQLRIERLKNVENDTLTPALSFEEVFTDLSGAILEDDLNLDNLNLSSLEGCPGAIACDYISISGNAELKTLDYLPFQSGMNSEFYCDFNQLKMLKDIDLDLFDNVADICIAIKDSDEPFSSENKVELTTTLYNLAHYLGFDILKFELSGLGSIVYPFSAKEFEVCCSLYEKVDFDQEKLFKALELL